MKVFKKKEKSDKNEALKTKLKLFYLDTKNRVESSVRLEIVFIASISLGVALIGFIMLSGLIRHTDLGRSEYVTYDENKRSVQNTLLSAVKQINDIEGENFEVKITVDFDELTRIMEDLEEGEQLYQLTERLNDGWRIDCSNVDISNLDQYYRESSGKTMAEQEVIALRKNFKELIAQNKWKQSNVEATIKKFYEEKGITTSAIKEYVTKQIIKDIDGPRYEIVDTKTYLIDSKGNLMYEEGFIKSLNIVKVIKKGNTNNGEVSDKESSFTSIYPVICDEAVCYLFNESVVRGETHYNYNAVGNIIGFIASAALFMVLVYQFTKRKIEYIEYLSYCLGEISKGDLSYKVEVVGEDELAKVARDMTHMENEIKLQIEAQKRAEKVKDELITNVAHDLRTPLTSILGYLGLVKDKRYNTEEEQDKYLDIAYTKAEKLKVLIEDLFEFTKLHNQAVVLKKESMSLTNLINQLIEELMPLAEEKDIKIQTNIEAKDTTIKVDIPKITRVFENLIENAVKYSQEGSTIYVEIKEVGETLFIAVKNRCTQMPQGDINRLFDRFYRADESRNSIAGGSGLGLAIAKNIVQLHDGQIWASKEGDLISFNVQLRKGV